MKNKKNEFKKTVQISSSAHIEDNVLIGDGCTVEANAVLRSGVRLGANSHVGPGCVLGERTRDYYRNTKTYKAMPCTIGKNAILRVGTVISGGVRIGDYFETGPYVTIREKTIIGHHSRFGNYSDIQGVCKIGNYVSAHSNVTVGQKSIIEDFAWLHPFVILINDMYPPTGIGLLGPKIGKYAVLGAGAMIFPGIKIGEHVIAAARAVIKKNVQSYQLVSGNPASEIGDCRKIVISANGKAVRPYPWMPHRSQGYPWDKRSPRKK